mmetsp:Transcript_167842/g.407980  ORF Transcript_167842/g.407980 Transcript_167842/m.407980 type:complete len:188 (+) Transcript_167842:230-793(+)
MFFRQKLKKLVKLPPQHFGPDIKNTVRHHLLTEMQGEKLPNGAHVITVTAVRDEDIGPGKLHHLTGEAEFDVTYEALLFRLFKNEVCDGIVTSTSMHGFWMQIGPEEYFVSHLHIPMPPDEDEIDPDNDEDELRTGYTFVAEQDRWVSEEDGREIKEGTKLRVKVISENGVVTMKDHDFLGELAEAS